MNICYNADSNYLRPLLISMHSICKYNKGLSFHIISYGGIELSDFEFIKDEFNVDVKIYSANSQMLSMKGHGRFPPVVFGRLYIPELIEEPKVLYIDVDTIVTSSLLGLWNEECEYICAVEESGSNIVNSLKSDFKLDDYFNAGVLLINTVTTRDIFSNAIEIAKNNNLPYLDQDAINISAKGFICSISNQYNYMSISKNKIKPVIIHFAHLKPWKRFCLHGYTKEYRDIEIKIDANLPLSPKLSVISFKDIIKNLYMRLN
ncbi:glycosyltransferase family 8 protein [Vibrio splendidus]|uniref:glycosyltransferase family 8 protein n=1 Tax=Vibrio splendidus TaxID=29497 RepID=UPI0034A0CE2A